MLFCFGFHLPPRDRKPSRNSTPSATRYFVKPRSTRSRSFAQPEAEESAWYRSHGDPIVGRSLSIMHANPSHPWTLAGLAAETGVSRAALARRFHDVVGEPPMTFLTGWRLALAADLLCEPDATVGSVATAARSRSARRSNGYVALARKSIELEPCPWSEGLLISHQQTRSRYSRSPNSR